MFDNMTSTSITVLGSLAMIGWSGFILALILSNNNWLIALGWIMFVGLFLIYNKIRTILTRRIHENNPNDGAQKENDIT